ncbi:hypothetical protein LTR37_006785 [Vermiconidia calcicola]|uniref:Uncharacterized protein n=1 Tax=Vermiconidia calcicola TaxID=1690605 RepID=A0ACC3NFL1_9PEZI|nr:hypothetical protein LTR37_006785 [Vermiconidia calcicola]
MRTSTILAAGLATIASAAPVLEERQNNGNYFQVSNFSYGCSVTCDWSFDVQVIGKTENHPPVDRKVISCSGTTEDTDFVECSDVDERRSILAYITPKNQLRLQYEVNQPAKSARYNYYGHKKVNSQTSGELQPGQFKVYETRATGIALDIPHVPAFPFHEITQRLAMPLVYSLEASGNTYTSERNVYAKPTLESFPLVLSYIDSIDSSF